jgi:hypothetical protein
VDKARVSNPGHAADAAGGPSDDASRDAAIQEIVSKEVNQMFNPLAIGVTLGGLLLDVVVPRPKPRAGISYESSLLSQRAVSRTPWHSAADGEYESQPIAGGSLR